MKRVIIILSILFFTFLNAGFVFANSVKFLQVTDVHTTKNNIGSLHEFVEKVNSYDDLDFVVFTGDNIDKSNIQDLELFLQEIKNIKFKTYVLLGNHDVFKTQNLDKTLYMKTVRKYLGSYHSDKAHYVFKCNGFVFVVVDGVKEVIPGANGYFKDSELAWLDKTLTKYKNNKVIILQHFPLLTAHSKGHETYRKEKYLEALSSHSNVAAIVSGHYHNNQEEMQGGVYNIVTKNFSNNKYYKIIELDSECDLIFTQLIEND